MLHRVRTAIPTALLLVLVGCAVDEADDVDPSAEADITAIAPSHQLTDDEAQATKMRGDCELKAGDLIFHRSLSEQAGAIAYLTKSELTHVGVVFQVAGAWSVYEAVGPVKITPLDTWINRGQGRRFATSRYKDGLDKDGAKALFEAGKPFFGKPYDLLFADDDAKIYCSELALKMYERSQTGLFNLFWKRQFAGLWTRVDGLEGWPGFETELAKPADSSDEKLVKKIMTARGVDAHAFASETLVAPVTLSDEAHSGGVFKQQCRPSTH